MTLPVASIILPSRGWCSARRRWADVEVLRERFHFVKEVPLLERFGRAREAGFSAENGPYLLHTTKDAADFIESVGRGNVKLQYDAYHMQQMEGNLVATMLEHVERITHVQVAVSPGRGEPETGEIHYPYVFGVLEDSRYDGYVGLEYNPTTPTAEESLGWLHEGLRGGDVSAKDLQLQETRREELLVAEKVGFIWLGIMGGPMAKNLMEAGHELMLFNHTREKAEELAKEGSADVAESPREVAEMSDVVITVLPDSSQVREILTGESGVLQA